MICQFVWSEQLIIIKENEISDRMTHHNLNCFVENNLKKQYKKLQCRNLQALSDIYDNDITPTK